MSIASRDFIFLDFQTTGTVAGRSDIIEAGWGLYRAEHEVDDDPWTSWLVALDNERPLNRTIQKLTGLSPHYYQEAPSITMSELEARLRDFLSTHSDIPILFHYAQFKVPFLLKALGEGRDELSEHRVVCIHKLSKKLLPGLKSYSLRAVAGYLGYSAQEKKRSIDHLKATAVIWRNLANLLKDEEISGDISLWLKNSGPRPDRPQELLPIHGDVLRKKRLALPKTPGVYFFLDRFDQVLYVGKAMSLHHRVNSYFRGRKTKGSRLNEMLTRVMDFRFVEVGSELEALLRENDEIKTIDPPYNRLLRVEGRSLAHVKFNDFLEEPVRWGYRNFGPMSSLWFFESLRPFIQTGELLRSFPAFMKGLTEGMIQDAFELLFARYGFAPARHPSMDDWQKLALIAWPIEHARLLEKQRRSFESAPELDVEIEEEEEVDNDEEEEDLSEKIWTAEDVEAFLRDAFLHLYRQFLRSRWYLRLVDCHIDWTFIHDPKTVHHYAMQCGEFLSGGERKELKATYAERLKCFDMRVYDRVGILYAEIRKGLKRGDAITLRISPYTTLKSDQLKTLLRP